MKEVVGDLGPCPIKTYKTIYTSLVIKEIQNKDTPKQLAKIKRNDAIWCG